MDSTNLFAHCGKLQVCAFDHPRSKLHYLLRGKNLLCNKSADNHLTDVLRTIGNIIILAERAVQARAAILSGNLVLPFRAVVIDFRAPGKYSIEKRSGSSMGAQVVKRILEHEVDIGASSQKSRSAAVTRENYLFSYLGEAVLDGQSYYLLRLVPRRQQPELITGQAWVDKQSFLIRLLAGTAKSPSIWVKKIHVQFDFDSPKGVWVSNNMEAVADVCFLGARKLTSHVMNYEAASMVADKIGAVPPIAAVLLSK